MLDQVQECLLGPVEVIHYDHQRSFSRQHLEKSPDGPRVSSRVPGSPSPNPSNSANPLGDEFGFVVSCEDLLQSPPRIACRGPDRRLR